MLLALVTCQDYRKKCINTKGDHLEEQELSNSGMYIFCKKNKFQVNPLSSTYCMIHMEKLCGMFPITLSHWGFNMSAKIAKLSVLHNFLQEYLNSCVFQTWPTTLGEGYAV